MGIRLLLVSREGVARQKYQDAIRNFGVQLDTVSTLRELYNAMTDTPYNGVLIDLLTKIKAPQDERTLIHEVLERFPVILLKWENKTETIKSLYYGQVKNGEILENFVTQECQLFKARKIRSNARVSIHFNIVLAKSDDLTEKNIEQTISIDVSRGGCFIYSTKTWKRESSAWFIIKELEDNTPIRGEVKWEVAWGKAMRVPGIGVMFKDIKECQLKEIYDNYPV